MSARKAKRAAWAGVLAAAVALVVAGVVSSRVMPSDSGTSSVGSAVIEDGGRLGNALRDYVAAPDSTQPGGPSSEQDAPDAQAGFEEEAAVPSTGSAPVSVPQGREVAWRESRVGRSWIFSTPMPARVVGKSLVSQLAGGAWELEEAGFLGLDDSAWGCVARALDDSGAVIVHARPNVTGMAVGDDNPLIVSVAFLEPVL